MELNQIVKCNFICCKIIDTTSDVPKSKLDTMKLFVVVGGSTMMRRHG